MPAVGAGGSAGLCRLPGRAPAGPAGAQRLSASICPGHGGRPGAFGLGLSVAAAYFRYPLAAALLGLAAAGLVLLPVLSVAQGFFLCRFPSDALPGLWAGAAYTWPWRPSGPDVCLFCPAPCF
ncbi:MAG: hypothetical protein ACLR5H_08070 [Oscillospiraceae bacterium]